MELYFFNTMKQDR